MKKHKFLLITITMGLVIGLCSAGVIVFSHWNTEASVDEYNGTEYTTKLFKDCITSSPAAAKALCEEFDLDYDTLTFEEYASNRDYIDYFSAASLKLECSDYVLLCEFLSTPENGEISSLESHCNDVYAFGGAKEIIEAVCDRDGIDVTTAKVDSLSIEQIEEIEATCYNTSDHPKD